MSVNPLAPAGEHVDPRLGAIMYDTSLLDNEELNAEALADSLRFIGNRMLSLANDVDLTTYEE